VPERAKRISYRAAEVLSYGAEACIMALVLLVTYSAISRYVFSKAVYFMEELGSILLAAIAFLSFAYAYTTGRHVNVTLIFSKFSKAVRNRWEVGINLVCLFFLFVWFKLMFDFVYTSYKINAHSANARIYLVPWMALIPLGLIVFAVAVLMFCINRAYKNVTKVEEK